MRYCEVFLINPGPNATTVYNTTGKDDCPTAQRNSLNPQQVAKQYHVQSVYKNGQRFWVMDELLINNTKETCSFNGVLATNWGTTTISSSGGGSAAPPYTVTVVNRSSQWFYAAGSLVYELLAPGGKRYIMQAYSSIVDKTLKLDDLLQLGYRLKLLAGWRYEAHVLDRNVSLNTVGGKANVIQDELQNSHMQLTSG